MANFYGENEDENSFELNYARERILEYVSSFLGWTGIECKDCYLNWKDSKKNHLEILGEQKVAILLEHMRKLGGVWPPLPNDALPEQKCAL